jgi:LacI family transcriptional regulator
MDETQDGSRVAAIAPATRRPATIRDVARLSGVDPSTVSRVLRDDPRQTVRVETRERILDATRVLNYRPNALAQSLRTRRTATFAVIVPTLDNPGFSDVFRGIQTEAAETGQLVLLVEADAIGDGDQGVAQREELLARLVLDGRADGLIVAFATLEDRLVGRLADRGLPLVLVNRRLGTMHGWVAVDDARGAELGVEHLIALGHERIGFIGFGQLTDTARRREEGFRRAMAAASLKVDPRWTASQPPLRQGGHDAMKEILEASVPDDRPTAVFCSSLLAAIGALAALREQSISVPAEMSLVAFNDSEIANDTAPPLTTVRLPNLRMGREAMRMAIRAANGLPLSDVMIEGPIEVVQRESTAPAGVT